MKARVLDYIQERPEEVFTYRDADLVSALGLKPGALSFTLWSLERDGLIDKAQLNGHTYFGAHAAIAELRRQKGEQPQGPWELARQNLERIRARVGNIDTLELLDAVRGPWD
ncbi:MAG: hypothetical protein Q7T33_01935 [Dehalococcoidia bacterium]|nr:hypothetical protein [Dehalococcoidia bacterium]